MKKYIAEFIGTFTLVLFGCGTAVVTNVIMPNMEIARLLTISFAFGLALIGMAYGIGPISGCHINPAVSIGAFVAGRMNAKDMILYIVFQILGAIAAAGVIIAIMGGIPASGLGQNGYDAGSPSGFGMIPAIVFEFVASLLFIIVILGSTQKEAPSQIAGLSIGLTLVVIHIFGIPITGVSVNPARSLGPAIFAGTFALSQVWLFIVVPIVAGIVAGLLFRTKLLEK